jgi:glycerol-3-phosphate acyltransferase PlsY
MDVGIALVSILAGYLLGSIPSGLIFVRLATGRDIRSEGSGRTGGTNAMRAGGTWVGLATGVLDVSKSILAILISRWLLPGAPWLEALTGLAAVFGHNYSIYLLEWTQTRIGKLPILRGGAGGAPTLGVAMAFWLPSVLIVVPIGAVIFFLVGYASMTTLVSGFVVLIIFLVRVLTGWSSVWYVIFGIGTLVLLVVALYPNMVRLAKGTERMVGLRAWLAQRKTQ